MKEKLDKQRARDRIVRAHIKALTTWKKTMGPDGQWSKEGRTIRQEYDSRGNIAHIVAFRNDTLSEQAAYTYGDAGDLLTDTDLTSTGDTIQVERYSYDSMGRVLSGRAYDGARRLVSSFVYEYRSDRRSITFRKFKSDGSFDYSIDFDYTKEFDISDYAGAVKKDSSGAPVLRVAVRFDGEGRMIRKDVMQEGSRLSFSYEYQYAPG
ncbi:MAG TPA: hypothetical protein VMH23_18570, partial [Bacteroidota bacterium]|nr:hypothetical protein [Bacteroidota bacterium]